MLFSVKMAESQLALYKKHQRRQNRSKSRQAIFISEYVFFKYFHIYEEAAKMYNEINIIYPRKPDLRRTEEFKVWRNKVTGRPNIPKTTGKSTVKPRPYVFPVHPNIPVAEHIDPNVSFVAVDQPESLQPESLQPESLQSESLQPESLQPESLQSESLQPESLQPESLQPESLQPESPHPESLQPESLQPESLQSESPHQLKGKVMELKIPLINPPKPKIYTETLEIITEEVLQEDTLEPSLYEEISPEIIEKIISGLRGDPCLKDMMTTIEEQIELEQIGLDIDIPNEDDRLETELESMIFW